MTQLRDRDRPEYRSDRTMHSTGAAGASRDDSRRKYWTELALTDAATHADSAERDTHSPAHTSRRMDDYKLYRRTTRRYVLVKILSAAAWQYGNKLYNNTRLMALCREYPGEPVPER